MTQPDDSDTATRPISVAELLAKNGTIGSPPVGGGRRRRRRGNNDSVTVAELTGEIPIVRLGDDGELILDGPDGYDTDADAHEPPERSPDPLPRRGRDAAPEHSHYPRPGHPEPVTEPYVPYEEDAPAAALVIQTAETMSPDPVDDAAVIVYHSTGDELGIGVTEPAAEAEPADDAELFSGDALLFAGETVAGEDVAGEDVEPIAGDLSDGLVGDDVDAENLSDTDLDGDGEYQAIYDYYDEPTRGQLFVRGLVVVLQSILAVVFGAGLFLAFNQLWHWNSLIAMVLAILATLGLVAGVWVVRKTEDIASTLIAVGVGLLVTFGPLALMHATN